MEQTTTTETRRLRVAFVMSRFPKLTETFILNEILAVERQGVEVLVFPLLRQRDQLLQPGAVELMARAHYAPFIGLSVLASQLRYIRRRPRAYLGALTRLIRENFGSFRLLTAGLLLFPKVVHAARRMEEMAVDHIHCHFATHPALAGLVIRRLTRIPYSFTAHGSDLHVDRHMLCRKVDEASFVVAISDFNRRVIEVECGSVAVDKVRIVHCGVDTQYFTAPAGRSIDGRMNPLRIVSVGTLHEVKGQRYLLEACVLLRQMGVPFNCRLIGSGPDEQLLRRLVVDLDLEAHVVLVGALPSDSVLRELREADVLVAPSVPSSDGRREGIPVVLMEAMSCGLPVVASRLSGIPELVIHEQSGLLVTPGDADELAAALCRLAVEPGLRHGLGRHARRRIEAEFDLHANAARLVALFHEAAA